VQELRTTLGTLSIWAFPLTITGGTNATSGTTGIAFGSTTFTGTPTFTITNGSGYSIALLVIAAVTNAANTAQSAAMELWFRPVSGAPGREALL